MRHNFPDLKARSRGGAAFFGNDRALKQQHKRHERFSLNAAETIMPKAIMLYCEDTGLIRRPSGKADSGVRK
jgi:hypothetical protein